MLKYTSAVAKEDGIISPHHQDIEYTRRTIDVSAGHRPSAKMAIKRRGGLKKVLSREQRDIQFKNQENQQHLPPISTPGASPQNMGLNSSMKENYHYTNQIKRKEIRTPYVSHINRVSDVATPYVLHTQITNVDVSGNANFTREHSKVSKYSGNVIEYKHDNSGDFRHEGTYSSLQKLPISASPGQDRRPRGRHGRNSSSFNEADRTDRNADLKDLAVQSNQMGLFKRAERKQVSTRDSGRAKADESFSIRKKIEQFRRWHEEQYKEKIKKLKQEVDNQFEVEQNRMARQVVQGALRETPTSKNDMSITVDTEKVPSETSHEKMDDDKLTPHLSSANDVKTRSGSKSARTWKTWRDVNESYAYNDVDKYIRENELMDDEKSVWIKKWILEVNKAMKDQDPESTL